jgi:hypothetical protein
MSFGLIDMGNYPPWTHSISFYFKPPISVYVPMQAMIHFIDYISIYIIYILALDHTSPLHYTLLGSRPHVIFTIHIASFGFENVNATFPSPYKMHYLLAPEVTSGLW